MAKGTPRGTADFGAGSRPTIGISWGDVTAWRSSGMPSVEVFLKADRAMERAASVPAIIKGALGTGGAQRFLKGQVNRRLPPGPTAEKRARGRAVVVAEAWGKAGRMVASRLGTPEPYALTAMEIVRRLAAGEAVASFRTPRAFGSDFILGFVGVHRLDVDVGD